MDVQKRAGGTGRGPTTWALYNLARQHWATLFRSGRQLSSRVKWTGCWRLVTGGEGE